MIKDEAVKLREKGYSYSLITEKIGVSKSTLSYWLRDIKYTPNQKVLSRIKRGSKVAGIKRNAEKISSIKFSKQAAREELGRTSGRDLFMLGIGLYIGEGSKSTESVRITNSDPRVVRLAMKWFRQSLKLKDNNFSLILFLYPDVDESAAKEYWMGVTGLKSGNFCKSQIDTRSGKKRLNYGKLPFGTLQIRIKSGGDKNNGVHLFRKIEEWISLVTAK